MGIFRDLTRVLRMAVVVTAVAAMLATVVAVIAPAPASAAGTGSLLITEFVAANSDSLTDEDGDSSDWIELFNPTANAVNLAGWSLSDDAADLTQWVLPATTIAAGDYLVIFASSKDRAVAGNELHTNFKLSAGGEYLAVVEPDGTTIADDYTPSYPAQMTDVSYGRNLQGQLGYFATPTPGSANGAQSSGFSESVTISLDHGFYTSAQTATLSTPTAGTIIRYTLDGSEPTASNGITYGGPLTIDQTTTLRAASVVPGAIPGEVATATYLFMADVVNQTATPAGLPTGRVNNQLLDYGMDPDVVNADPTGVANALQAIPTISVVTDADNLFDETIGIYVNPDGSGREWERPASVELIDPSGIEAGFEIDAGLRIRGGFSRSTNNPKHAFRLFFRSDYDGSLDYPLFGTEGTDSFEKVDLRTAQNYSWSFRGSEKNTMLREVFSRDLQADLGQPYTRTRYYHLYLNGQYWGIYQSQERVSKEYAASYFGGSDDDYDVVKHDRQNGFRYDATDGNDAAWRALWPMIEDQQVDAGEYAQLDTLVDLDSLIDSQLIYAYTGDIDGSPSRFLSEQRGNNWYSLRNRNGTGDAGKWQFFVHDGEHAVGARDHDPDIDRTGPFPTGANNPIYSIDYLHPYWIHSALLSHPDYEARFEARANEILRGSGPMTPGASQTRWDAREAVVAPAVLAESARWGDAKNANPYGVSDWANEVAWVENNFFPVRTQNVLAHLGLPATLPNDPPVIADPGPQASTVADAVSVTVTATDPQNQTISWSATGLPSGLTLNASTGEIAGQAAEAGVFAITVTATDTLGEFDTTTFDWTTTFPSPSRMILNEWNAVDSGVVLKNGGSDSVLGTVIGNGGDWFELVIIEDNVDIRGWTLEISDNDNALGEQEITDVFEFADQPLLASLRAGTIITVSEDFADDASYNPAAGDWTLNLQANSDDQGAFFTADSQSNFGVNNSNWQLTIRDASGSAVFGPAGEGAGASGVGSDEIGELEDDPTGAITPASLFDDGNDSTFGEPNGFDARFQDFSLIRPVLADVTEPDAAIASPTLGEIVPDTTVTISGTATDDAGVAVVQIALKDRDSNGWLRADGTFGNLQWLSTDLTSPGATATDWATTLTLPEGRWFLTVRAEDTSGNRDTTRPSTRFEVALAVADFEDPNGEVSSPTVRETLAGPSVVLTGTATDDVAVTRVRLAIQDRISKQYLQADGTFGGFTRIDATLSAPDTTTTDWSLAVDLPDGDYAVSADVTDGVDKRDQTRARVPFSVSSVAPDNVEPDTAITAPTVRETIGGPTITTFGSATDDIGVTRVRLALRNLGTGEWLQADGTFATTYALVDADLGSPGDLVTGWSLAMSLPAGDYVMTARGVDAAGNVDSTRPRVRFTVT